MIAAVLRWLPVSLALHSAALAATLLLPRDAALLPLFVDLTVVEPITPPDRPSEAPRAAPRPLRIGQVPTAPPPSSPVSPPPLPTPAPADPPTASTPAATPPPPASEATAEPAVATPPAPVRTTTEIAAAPTTATELAGGGAASNGIPAASGTRETAMGAGEFGATGGGSVSSRDGAGETLALGIGGEDGGVYAGYIALLRRRVQEALTYPAAARRRGMTGTVHLDISVEPTGRIADVLVVRSSSHELLDAAALDAVRTLRQIPFPAGVRPRAVRVRLPVVFELR